MSGVDNLLRMYDVTGDGKVSASEQKKALDLTRFNPPLTPAEIAVVQKLLDEMPADFKVGELHAAIQGINSGWTGGSGKDYSKLFTPAEKVILQKALSQLSPPPPPAGDALESLIHKLLNAGNESFADIGQAVQFLQGHGMTQADLATPKAFAAFLNNLPESAKNEIRDNPLKYGAASGLFNDEGKANETTCKTFLMGLKSAKNAMATEEREYTGQMFKMDLAEIRSHAKIFDYYS